MAAETISPAKAYQKAREEQFELRSRRQSEKTARNASKDKTHTATTLSGDTVTIRTPVLDETKKNSRISAVDDLWERDAAGQNKKNDTTANTGNGRVSVGAGRETTKEDTWLQKSAYFEDGYDFGDVTKTVIATARDFKDNMAAGLLGIGEQGLDTLAYFGPAASQMQFIQGGGYYNLHNQAAFDSTQKAAKKAVSDFVAKDLYDEEVLAKRAYENSLARKILPVDIENGSVFGERMDTLAQSTGQLAGKVALSPIVPWPVTTAVTSFGGEVENALRQGATYEQAGLSGVNTAVWDTLPERLSGGISFGSKALTDALTKRIAGSVPGKAGSALTKLGLDMIGEGAEGVVSQFGSNLGSALYRDAKLGEILFGEEARQGYRDSFVGDAILGGFGSAGKLLPGTADLDSRISDLKRQLEAVRYENDLAALMAEYEKHVPLPDYTLPHRFQTGTESDINVLKGKIASGELSGKISFQMQSKHIEGTPQYEQYKNSRLQKGDKPQSILTISREEAQELVDRFSGTGDVSITPSGQNSVKIIEYITVDKVVGKHYMNNKFVDTKRFAIYYSRRGVHIVPVKEIRK